MESLYDPKNVQCGENYNLKEYFTTKAASIELTDNAQLEDKFLLNIIAEKIKATPVQRKEALSIFKRSGSLEVPDKQGSESKSTVKTPLIRMIEVTGCFHVDSVMKKSENNVATTSTENPTNTTKKSTKPAKNLTQPTKTPTQPTKTPINPSNELKPGKDFVVTIRVFEPFSNNALNKVDTVVPLNMKFSHELVVLGSNTLAEFRDKIACPKDLGLSVEVDHLTPEMASLNVKDVYPSGFIFIDGVFYNDRRHPDSIDYSEVLRPWCEEHKIGKYTTALMENTKISDLKPKFGYPYVYQHQANCEHIIQFCDTWLLGSRDILDRSCYPMYSNLQRCYSKPCTICYATIATWVVTDSNRLPHRNTFLCQDCFTSYCFKDNVKLGTFKAYPFYGRTPMV